MDVLQDRVGVKPNSIVIPGGKSSLVQLKRWVLTLSEAERPRKGFVGKTTPYPPFRGLRSPHWGGRPGM